MDGTDPRFPGGGISPAAQLDTEPIAINNNAHLVARSRSAAHTNLTGGATNGNPPVFDSVVWGHTRSLRCQSGATLGNRNQVSSRTHARRSATDSEDFEFIELKNPGAVTLSLPGVRFTEGVASTLTASSGVINLAPGGSVVIVKNQSAFQQRYPGVTNIAGEYTGALDNEGDRLVLLGPLSEPIHDFTFDDAWYPATDGDGASLVVVDETAATSASGWRPSTGPGGSPGATDPPRLASSNSH